MYPVYTNIINKNSFFFFFLNKLFTMKLLFVLLPIFIYYFFFNVLLDNRLQVYNYSTVVLCSIILKDNIKTD